MDILSRLQPIGKKYTEGRFQECLEDLKNLWESVPEPKASEINAYLIIEYFGAILIKLGKYDEAYIWAIRGTMFNKARNLAGEAEYLLGKIAFEKGDIEFAKDMFFISKKRSGGRCFKGVDEKRNDYKALISDYDIK